MSVRHDVVDLIEELGIASGDDLVPHLPDYTRDQVFQALQNAKWDGRIVIVEKSKALGKGLGRTAAKYGLAPEAIQQPEPDSISRDVRPANSVWEWGARACQ